MKTTMHLSTAARAAACLLVPGAFALAACSKSSDSAQPPAASAATTSSAPAAAASPAVAVVKTTCADWNGKGKGTFGSMCNVTGPSPFKITWTGKYIDDFGDKKPEFQVTNNFDHAVSWGDVSVWYYDKDGKVLDLVGDDGSKFKRWYVSGSGVIPLKPGETKPIAFGLKQKSTPANFDSMEAEVTGWGWDEDPKMFFSGTTEHRDDEDARPKGGWN